MMYLLALASLLTSFVFAASMLFAASVAFVTSMAFMASESKVGLKKVFIGLLASFLSSYTVQTGCTKPIMVCSFKLER